MGARRAAVPVVHLRILAYSMNLQVALLEGDAVDVHGPVAALSGNVLVERVPRHALHVVIMFGDFVHALA